MNPNEKYNPADDDNQGVIQLMAQGEEASNGIPQAEQMDIVKAQGPEPEKEEVNDSETDAININDDILVEEEVEHGEIEEDNDE